MEARRPHPHNNTTPQCVDKALPEQLQLKEPISKSTPSSQDKAGAETTTFPEA